MAATENLQHLLIAGHVRQEGLPSFLRLHVEAGRGMSESEKPAMMQALLYAFRANRKSKMRPGVCFIRRKG